MSLSSHLKPGKPQTDFVFKCIERTAAPGYDKSEAEIIDELHSEYSRLTEGAPEEARNQLTNQSLLNCAIIKKNLSAIKWCYEADMKSFDIDKIDPITKFAPIEQAMRIDAHSDIKIKIIRELLHLSKKIEGDLTKAKDILENYLQMAAKSCFVEFFTLFEVYAKQNKWTCSERIYLSSQLYKGCEQHGVEISVNIQLKYLKLLLERSAKARYIPGVEFVLKYQFFNGDTCQWHFYLHNLLSEVIKLGFKDVANILITQSSGSWYRGSVIDAIGSAITNGKLSEQDTDELFSILYKLNSLYWPDSDDFWNNRFGNGNYIVSRTGLDFQNEILFFKGLFKYFDVTSSKYKNSIYEILHEGLLNPDALLYAVNHNLDNVVARLLQDGVKPNQTKKTRFGKVKEYSPALISALDKKNLNNIKQLLNHSAIMSSKKIQSLVSSLASKLKNQDSIVGRIVKYMKAAFILEDTACTPTAALDAFKAIDEQDKVDFLKLSQMRFGEAKYRWIYQKISTTLSPAVPAVLPEPSAPAPESRPVPSVKESVITSIEEKKPSSSSLSQEVLATIIPLASPFQENNLSAINENKEEQQEEGLNALNNNDDHRAEGQEELPTAFPAENRKEDSPVITFSHEPTKQLPLGKEVTNIVTLCVPVPSALPPSVDNNDEKKEDEKEIKEIDRFSLSFDPSTEPSTPGIQVEENKESPSHSPIHFPNAFSSHASFFSAKRSSEPTAQSAFNRCCEILKDETNFWDENPRLGDEAKRKSAIKLIELLFGVEAKQALDKILSKETIKNQPISWDKYRECCKFLTENTDIWESPNFELEIQKYAAKKLISVLFGVNVGQKLENVIKPDLQDSSRSVVHKA